MTDDKKSEWIGKVGERVTVTVTVEAIRYFESDYGSTVLYSLRDEHGNVFKWFASREALGDKEGVTVTLAATVKKHDKLRGIKQTVLTRGRKETV